MECSLLAVVVLSMALFFWGLNANITHFQELDMLIYQSIADIKDEIYIYSKIEEYAGINKRCDEILEKIQSALHMDLDEENIKNTINGAVLNALLLQKIKRRWACISDVDLTEAFHLKDYPEIKTSIESGNLVVEAYSEFELPSVLNWFKSYHSCIRYEIGCRNIDKILFGSDVSESSSQKIQIFITQNGLENTLVFHRNIRCFGLRTADEIQSVEVAKDEDLIEYRGVHLHLCIFCRMGLIYDSKEE